MAKEPIIYEAKIEDFIDDPNNANRGTERGHYMIDKSVQETGLHRGVFADRNGVILGGNKTRQAAVDAGYTKAIVVETDGDTLVVTKRRDFDLSDPDNPARLAAYADNRTGQVNLDFDFDVISSDIEAGLDLSDFWFDWELEGLEEEPKKELPPNDAEPQISRADELREKWGVELGQLWRLPSRVDGQEHLLICGDCTDPAVVGRVMGGEKADMVWTDPPYGMDLDTDYSKLKGTEKSPNALGYKYKPVMGDDVEFDFSPFEYLECKEQFWWGADYYARQLPMGGSWDVWIKRNEADTEMIGNDFELCWSKSKHKRHGIRIRWVGWDATEKGEKRAHPTQKPVKLAEWYFSKYSKESFKILDFYGGSGTTMVASENLGRQCRMVEIEPSYCAVILQRMVDAFGIVPELIENTPGENIGFSMAGAA